MHQNVAESCVMANSVSYYWSQMLVHLAEAPINLRNFYGETALHLAVEGGFTDIVEVKFESNSIFCFDGVASPGKCNASILCLSGVVQFDYCAILLYRAERLCKYAIRYPSFFSLSVQNLAERKTLNIEKEC